MRTAIAYVDGFNFYHGVVKDVPELKWLDYQALCERLLRRGYRVTEVNYYTAKVTDRPDDPSQSQRQDTYLRALRTRPKINVVLGQFQRNRKTVMLTSGKLDRAWIYEEKGSDVNLATDLSWDAAQGRMDAALVLCDDFDQQWAINRAIAAGIEVIVVNPHHRVRPKASVRGSDLRTLSLGMLRSSQLPDVVRTSDGIDLHRPSAWR